MIAADISGAVWRKSSRSGSNSNCVEFAELPMAVALRDSKDPHGAALLVNRRSWTAFMAGIRDGGFAVPDGMGFERE